MTKNRLFYKNYLQIRILISLNLDILIYRVLILFYTKHLQLYSDLDNMEVNKLTLYLIYFPYFLYGKNIM